MKIFTLAEFKTELGITDGSKDTELNLVIDRISLIIEGFLGYSLDLKTSVEYYDEGVVEFIGVQMKIADENTIIVTEKELGQNLVIDYVDGKLIYFKEKSLGGKLKISYQSGYTDNTVLPADLKAVGLSWGVTSFNNILLTTSGTSGDLEIKTKKLGSLSLTYFSPNEVKNTFENGNDTGNGQPSDYSVLDKYKNNFIY